MSFLSFVKRFPGVLILLPFGILSKDTFGKFLGKKKVSMTKVYHLI